MVIGRENPGFSFIESIDNDNKVGDEYEIMMM